MSQYGNYHTKTTVLSFNKGPSKFKDRVTAGSNPRPLIWVLSKILAKLASLWAALFAYLLIANDVFIFFSNS